MVVVVWGRLPNEICNKFRNVNVIYIYIRFGLAGFYAKKDKTGFDFHS